jgi:hypothetical protein
MEQRQAGYAGAGLQKSAFQRAQVTFREDHDRFALAQVFQCGVHGNLALAGLHRDVPGAAQVFPQNRYLEKDVIDQDERLLAQHSGDEERVGGAGMVGRDNLGPLGKNFVLLHIHV